MWLWLLSAASAAPVGEDLDDGDDLDVPDHRRPPNADDEDAPVLDLEDEVPMTDFVAEAKRKAPPPTWFHVEPAGQKALADNFDVQIVAFSHQFVVVQLPVVVAANRASFVVEHPHGLSLVAEIEAGTHKLVQRHEFTAAGVLADAPTLAFFQAALPIAAKTGTVRFVVKSADWPAPEDLKRKAVSAPPMFQERFSRSATFTRP